MPSGYTCEIEKGITFRQFAMRCARAMGACIMMRDDPLDAPIPETFEPDDYHPKEIALARARLDSLSSMTVAEADREAVKAFMENKRYCEESIKERNGLRAKYMAVLSGVNHWTPPTKDHEGLKDFMLEQIKEGMRFDCSTDYFFKRQLVAPLSGSAWLAHEKAKALDEISYHEKEYALEAQRAADRTAWIKALRQSL